MSESSSEPREELLWRHLRAVVVLPGSVLVLIPAVLLIRGGVSPEFGQVGVGRLLFPLAGALLGICGLALLWKTVVLFDRVGRGTLAPWYPTCELVIEGVYRHVRNPMISGVVCALLGEGLLFRSLAVLAWAGIFFIINAVYIPLVEERSLAARFGEDYRKYRRVVPRWIPRRRPWDPSAEEGREPSRGRAR